MGREMEDDTAYSGRWSEIDARWGEDRAHRLLPAEARQRVSVNGEPCRQTSTRIFGRLVATLPPQCKAFAYIYVLGVIPDLNLTLLARIEAWVY
jgi:hypothetical protein